MTSAGDGQPAEASSGRLTGKLAVVTGAAQGIGEAIARRFVAEGARTVLTDNNAEGGRRVATELGASATFVELDVRSESDWDALASGLEAAPSVLVNNAGGLRNPIPLHQIAPDRWREEIELNLTGAFLGMRALIPLMVQAGGGSVINMSSVSGVAGHPDGAGYQAAKGGIRMLTRNGAQTYADAGVRVNSIQPGIVATPPVEADDPKRRERFIAKTPLGRMGRPLEVAHAAVYLASDESSFVTGTELSVDGGFLAG